MEVQASHLGAWLKAWAPEVSRADLPKLLRGTLAATVAGKGLPSFKRHLDLSHASSHYLERNYITVQSTGVATYLSIFPSVTLSPLLCVLCPVQCATAQLLLCTCQSARLGDCKSPGCIQFKFLDLESSLAP